MKTIILFIAMLTVYTSAQVDSIRIVYDKPVYIGKEPIVKYQPPIWIGDTNSIGLNLRTPANKALPVY